MASLLGSVAGAAGSLLTSGTPLTAAGAQAQGQSWIQKMLSTGFPIGWFGLFILAGAIPVAPFSYWGYGGVNLMATGATGWAALKGVSQIGSKYLSVYIETYHPKYWPYAWLLKYSPWYVFDLIQMFNPHFNEEGFRIPFFNKQIGRTGGGGSLTALVIMAAIGLFSLGGYSLMSYLPPEIVGAAAPVMKIVFLAIGGVTALAGGGIGAYVLLPQVLAAMKGNATTAQAAYTEGAKQKMPTAPAPVSTARFGGGDFDHLDLPHTLQTGGNNGDNEYSEDNGDNEYGEHNNSIKMESKMPSLEAIATGLLDPSKGGAEHPATQSGGGKDDDSPLMFLSLLGIIIFGGYSLALVRSKQM